MSANRQQIPRAPPIVRVPQRDPDPDLKTPTNANALSGGSEPPAGVPAYLQDGGAGGGARADPSAARDGPRPETEPDGGAAKAGARDGPQAGARDGAAGAGRDGGAKDGAAKDGAAKDAAARSGQGADGAARARGAEGPGGAQPRAQVRGGGAGGAAGGSARKGGAAGDDAAGDSAFELSDELSDAAASSQLITEWFAEPPPLFDDNPLRSSFEGASSIDLKVVEPPRPPGDGAASQALSPEQAASEAGQVYARIAGNARDGHDEIVREANRSARRVFDQSADAIARLDMQLQPTLDGVVTVMGESRRSLAGAVAAAEEHLDAEAAAARRRAGGAAAAGRRAVSAASQRMLKEELPKLRKEQREAFTTIYDTNAKEVEDSGTKTKGTLQSPATHTRWLDYHEYDHNATAGPQTRAMNEGARPEIPPRLNYLGDKMKEAADGTGQQLRKRIDTAPPNGGLSIGAGIDKFVEALRTNIAGDAAAASAAAVQQALPTQGAAGAAVEGARAFASTASTGSLEKRGHTAIGRSHGEALRSLVGQLADARKAVRHAKRSGDKQLATQRAGALTRLAGLRKARIDAMRETANQAAKAIRDGAKSAVAFYAESTRKLADRLQKAAARGPAALNETATQSAPVLTTAIVDGRRVQGARLAQVGQGAERQITRLSETVPVDAAGASLDFERTMGEVSRSLAEQVDDAARAHSKHFADVARGVTQTTQSFTAPLPTMFKSAIDETEEKSLGPIRKQEKDSVEKNKKAMVDQNDAIAKDPHTHPKADLQERWRGAKKARDDDLAGRATKMRGAFGTVFLDENALMEGARGVTGRGGNSIVAKYAGDLYGALRSERDAILGGLNSDEYNAIINYLAGRTAEGARFELKTTVHWYGNDTGRAAKIMEDIGREARKELVGRSDWAELAKDVRDGMRGTDLNVFNAYEQDNATRARAYRTQEEVDSARRRNDSNALQTAVTPFKGEAIVDGKVVSAEQQLAEFQREFAVVIGKAKAPNEISQEDAAKEFADYATRDVKVLVIEGDPRYSQAEERTYTITGPEKALTRSLAMHGENHPDTRAARVLFESERSGKPNLEKLESAAVDPRLNPTLTPELTQDQRDAALKQQDDMYLAYAKLARENGIPVTGTTAKEVREYLAARLSSHYDKSDDEQLGAKYAASIVLEKKPDPVLAMRYAMEPSGTDMGLIRRTLGRLSRDEVKQLAADYERDTGKNLYSELGVYGHGNGEVSGDERLEVERLLMGAPKNDRERGEVALYQNLQQQRETGFAGKAALAGGLEERRMLAAEQNLREVMGGTIEYDEFNRPVQRGGSFDDRGRYNGPSDTRFLLAVNRATQTAEAYSAAIDRLASTITTIIAVIGAVVAAVLTVVTGGLAAPLMIAALSFGLAGMAANAMIRGGRYGWEEALTDLGMVGVQVLTAGLGAQLGAAAKVANTAAATARAGGTVAVTTGTAAAKAGGQAAAKSGLTKLFTGNPIVDQIIIGAITGGVGGVGQTALQAETWKGGLLDGIGNSLVGGIRGSLAGAVTSAATNSLEALPVGRGAVAAMRAGKDYRSLGSEISRMSAGGGPLRGTLGVGGRAVARGGLQAVGGMAGRTTEIVFDQATGKYRGSLSDALGEIGEAGVRSGLQGLAEGAGEAFGQRRRDIKHPEEAQQREAERARQIKEENELLRASVHGDVTQAAEAAPAPAVPGRVPGASEVVPDVGRRPGAVAQPEPAAAARMPPREAADVGGPRPAARAGEAQELPSAVARSPIAEEALRIARPDAAGAAPRPAETGGADGTPPRAAGPHEDAAAVPGRRAPRAEAVEGAAARMAGTEMQLAPHAVIHDERAALARALPEVLGEGGPLRGRAVVDHTDPGPGVRVLLERADGELMWVRIVVGDTEHGNVANFARASGDDQFVVTLSRSARETVHARALAHELEELRFHRSPTAAPHALPAEADLLRSSRASSDPDARLSPHDRGRLAELQVLAREIAGARLRQDTPEVARIQGEIAALAAHLGLLHSDAGDPRLTRALAALPPESPAHAELTGARERAAVPGADDRLRVARELSADARLSASDRRALARFEETAARLADARVRGDREEMFSLTRALADQADRMGLLATDSLGQRRVALASTAFESDSTAARALGEMRARFGSDGGNDALRPGHTPDAQTVLSPRDRDAVDNLNLALGRLRSAESAGADPQTVARLRHDGEARAMELGLVHGAGAGARLGRVQQELGAAAAGLDGVLQEARTNPLLKPRSGTIEDLPLLARQVARAQELGDTRLATELTEIVMLRLRDAGVSRTGALTPDAQALVGSLIGADAGARALVADAAQRQAYRQSAEGLRGAAAGVRRDIDSARARLANVGPREQVSPGVVRRSPEEAAIRREIAALERRAAILEDGAGRAERRAFRPAGTSVDAALAARSDDPMFSIAPRLKHDPDYPGNPTAVRLTSQLYGDSPQFQSWSRFRELYYDVFPSTRFFGVHGTDTDHIERVVFGRWRAAKHVNEATGTVQALDNLPHISAVGARPVPTPTGAPRVLADTATVTLPPAAEGQPPRTMTAAEAETHRRDLIASRATRQAELDATPASDTARRDSLTADVAALGKRINDASEALGSAAAREFARERFGNTGTLHQFPTGAGVFDLVHVAPNGRVTVIECKGGDSPLGFRIVTSEGVTVRAQQATPEYVRSIALQLPANDPLRIAVLAALDRTPPNIDSIVVRQPFEAGGNRGAIDVRQYPMERSGR